MWSDQRAAVGVLAFSCAVGCARGEPRAWETGDAGAGAPSAPLPSGPVPTPAAGDGGAPDPDGGSDPEPAAPVIAGGAWVRCYGHFKPSGEPVRDVTRLSLLCGPANGMKRLAKAAMSGSLRERGAPVSESFEAKRGACYRIFAVGEAGVGDLDLALKSSRGSTIATDHGEDVWPIIQADRPVCALEDDRWTVEVGARRGGGAFAAEIWVLEPRDDGDAH